MKHHHSLANVVEGKGTVVRTESIDDCQFYDGRGNLLAPEDATDVGFKVLKVSYPESSEASQEEAEKDKGKDKEEKKEEGKGEEEGQEVERRGNSSREVRPTDGGGLEGLGSIEVQFDWSFVS